MKQDEKNKPTNARSKFVGLERIRSRFIRQFLAVLVRFFRRMPPQLPSLSRDLSLWICDIHGLGQASPIAEPDRALESRKVEMLRQFTPEMNPETVRQKTASSKAIASEAGVPQLIETVRQGSGTKVNKDFEKMLQKLLKIWLPALELPFEFSLVNVLAYIRAARALFLCTALQGTHPLILIARAWRGDQQAVIDLVKVDKLFLQDRCTQGVIREATLQNDQQFLDELAKAQAYWPTVHTKDLIHLYFYVLCMWEAMGQTLPRIDELQRLLDPNGTKFKGVFGFERDLQRRRQEFREMLAQGDAEIPTLLSFYSSTLPNAS